MVDYTWLLADRTDDHQGASEISLSLDPLYCLSEESTYTRTYASEECLLTVLTPARTVLPPPEKWAKRQSAMVIVTAESAVLRIIYDPWRSLYLFCIELSFIYPRWPGGWTRSRRRLALKPPRRTAGLGRPHRPPAGTP